LKPKIKSGVRTRRIKRPQEKNLVVGYDSNWEYKLHSTILNDWNFHTEKIQYIVEHTYNPDFIKVIDNKKVYLEAKGRFWDHNEYNKYVWIAKALPDNVELVFLFADPEALCLKQNVVKTVQRDLTLSGHLQKGLDGFQKTVSLMTG